MPLQSNNIHELVMFALSKCKLNNENGNEIDLAREVYEKYNTISNTIINEYNKPSK